jgi:hypothetical protein
VARTIWHNQDITQSRRGLHSLGNTRSEIQVVRQRCR